MIILCGTNRPEARTRKVARLAEGLINKELAARSQEPAYLLDLAELKPEIFLPEAYSRKPQWFEAMQQRILSARGILVVTPEYNGSFPGVMKYFIDMLRFPESFVGVPVAFVGLADGMFGALRSVEQLELIFHYRNAHIFGKRLFVPNISAVLNEGASTLGPQQARLEKLISEFVDFALRIKN